MPVSRSPVPPVAIPALPVEVHERATLRPRDDRPVPFQDDMHAMAGREVSRVLEAIGLHLLDGHSEQPRHLSRVWRDDHVDAVAAGEPIGVANEGVQRVGVDHSGTPARSTRA